MKFVLDNSVTMRWLFEDGSRSDLAYADKILASMTKWSAIVPGIWGLEVANVLARAEGQRHLTPDQSGVFINTLNDLDIEVDSETFDRALSGILKVARRHNLSSYDASYLELAVRMDAPLATLDKGLRKAAKKTGVEVTRFP